MEFDVHEPLPTMSSRILILRQEVQAMGGLSDTSLGTLISSQQEIIPEDLLPRFLVECRAYGAKAVRRGYWPGSLGIRSRNLDSEICLIDLCPSASICGEKCRLVFGCGHFA
jgi:hypothetical protein